MPHRFLLVDDHPGIRARIRAWLAECYPDAGVVEVDSAEAAVATDGEFSAVLLDVQLPGRSGLAAIPALRARRPATPVVMVSGAPRESYAPAALRAGAAAFVAKEKLYEDLGGVLAGLVR
jgi:two-component system, NarL family, invasion response regulator UvrY